MPLYSDSRYHVRDDLAGVHARQIDQLADPGAWGTGAQRLAVAVETRQAGYEAGRLEPPAGGAEAANADLPEAARTMVRRLAVDPKDLNEESYEEARRGGLSDEEYVEIVGLVARVTNLDIFARGIGVDLRPLPTARPGAPSRERPAAAVQELAWVPTVPNPPDGGAAADELYGGKPKPYIVRGMSLVPDELRRHLELEEVQYLPLHRIMVPDYQHHEGFSRAQAEVVAGRVSAINECFF